MLTFLQWEDSCYGQDVTCQLMATSNDVQSSSCCETPSGCSNPSCSMQQPQSIGIEHIQQHRNQHHSPKTPSTSQLCFQSPSVTTTEIGNFIFKFGSRGIKI